MSPLKILYASAEVAPVAKVGGLADVAGSLPQAIRELGHDIRLVMPAYAGIDRSKFNVTPMAEFNYHFMGSLEKIGVGRIELDGNITLYIIENHRYFGRDAVYGEPDDLERFAFFSQVILELPYRIGWYPDVLHCQDWHAALAIPLLKIATRNSILWPECASVFTIHNLAYQGWFDGNFASRIGINDLMLPAGHPLYSKIFSTMALAIWHANILSTVSPTYAREILTPQYGENIELLLQQRSQNLYGIINGLDYKQYNPATDPSIKANYNISKLKQRPLNKQALQEVSGLDIVDSQPLIGMVGRLAAQKGTDLVAQALGPLLDSTDIQFVFLGTGEEIYEVPLEQVANSYPNRVKLFFNFDEDIARLIYAGSDLFLMPSLFEPCGLGQLISLRYGSIPVVRRTGGLTDTVQDVNSDLSRGNGFVFDEYKSEALIEAIKRAVNGYKQRTAWKKLMLRGMKADYSWQASARKYEELYHKAVDQLAGT